MVAGASEGLGAAFATELAARGLNLILIARRLDKLNELGDQLKQDYSVQVKTVSLDLANLNAVKSSIEELTEEIGLLVYNAAFSPIGYFNDVPTDQLLQATEVNVKTPLLLIKILAQPMLERKRGGIILMSSLSGLQGSPKIATYSATKAFNTTLAEALWREFKEHNVDVLACIAGAIRTPGYIASQNGQPDAPGTLNPDEVVKKALQGLGKGPLVVPGFFNRIARLIMSRILPRKTSISIMYNNTKDLS